jgi:hypothetical protein
MVEEETEVAKTQVPLENWITDTYC